MTATRRQLVETAYHEAGHAVAAIDLGLPFTEAVVKKDGSGYVGPGVRLPRHWGHHFFPHGRERAEDQIVLFVAGPIAEARLTGRRMDPLIASQSRRNDWYQVQRRYDILKPDADLAELIDQARALIDRRWRDIEFIATALVERLRLSADEVRAEIVLARPPIPVEYDDLTSDDLHGLVNGDDQPGTGRP